MTQPEHLPARDAHTPVHAWRMGHDVQFYETEGYFVDQTARFIAEGYRAGQPAVVIATDNHCVAIKQRLRELGVDLEDRTASRDLVFLDARHTLSAFMQGNRPDAELFRLTVGNVFEKLMRGRPYVIVRAVGEMVDILWRDGKAAAAMELEELWNDLARSYAFSLLCGYDQESLVGAHGEKGVADICAAHSHVRAIESESLATRLGLKSA